MENQLNQDPLNQTPVNQEPQITQPPIETPVQTPVETQSENTNPTNQYQSVLNQYASAQPQPPIVDSPPRSTDQQLQDLGIAAPPKTSGGFLKAIFIVTLIIFLLVMAALGLVYFKSQQNQNQDSSDTSSFDTVKSSPTPTSGNCFLNDKTYQVGDSFVAADGCNTCSCQSQDTITCTEKECLSTNSSTKSAVKIATTSAAPKGWKTYTDSTYKYSIQYPSTWIINSKIIDNQILLISSPERIKDLEKNLTGTIVEGEITIYFNKDLYQKILNKNQTVEEYLKSLEDVSNIKKTKIGNIDAFRFDIAGMQNTPTYYIIKANDIFSITSSSNFSQTELQLLNTFKFN